MLGRQKLSIGDVLTGGIDPAEAIETYAVGYEHFLAGDRIKSGYRRNAVRGQHQILRYRDVNAAFGNRIDRRGPGAVPAKGDAAERSMEYASLFDESSLHVNGPRRRERCRRVAVAAESNGA